MKNTNLIIFYSLMFFLIFIFPKPAYAFVPVTYKCCNNFSYSNGNLYDGFENINVVSGNQLDNFENLSGWTVGLGAQYADKVNYKEGTQSLGLISPYNNRAYTDKIINNNFSLNRNFSTWIYVYNSSSFAYPVIYLTSTGSLWSKYFLCGYWSGMYNGWNKWILDGNSCSNYNGESWNNAMNRIRIAMFPKTNASTQDAVDDLRYNISSEWTVGGTGASQEYDKINFKEGSGGLKLNAVNGYRAYSDKSISTNFTNTSNFALWLYVDNASSFDFLRMYLTSTGDLWSKYYQCNIYSPGYTAGWNRLVFDKNWCVNFYNESWKNQMNKIRIAIYPKTGQNTSVTVDDLRTNMNGQKGKIIITFDDGDKNVSAKALPILSANNQSAVSFVVTSWISNNSADFMSLSDLKNLQSSGWDISSHTVDHPDLTGVTDWMDNATLIQELNNSYDWLAQNNFKKSAGFIAYPFGYFDDNVINYVKKRYIFGRSTSMQPIIPHFDPSDESELYIQRVIYVLNTTSVQAVTGSIDDIINNKLLGVMLFHDIVDPSYKYGNDPDNDPYRYKTSDFKNISDYLKSRSNDIDVVTYSDYVIPNIYNFTPVINKTTRIYSNGTSVLITKNKYDEYMPNMTVKPIPDSIDIGVSTYNESGGLIRFNESSQNSNLTASYSIGDRIPNQSYSVKIYWANGTKYKDFNVIANNSGYINYNSDGFGDSRYQEITYGGPVDTSFTISLPAGHTFLRFNASGSTVSNLNPDGQNSSQPIFNIVNSGNINQSFMLNLNDSVSNVTTYADLSNNFSEGKIEVNTTPTIIIPNLVSGSNQNIWMIIDANKAPVVNTNKTITINGNS